MQLDCLKIIAMRKLIILTTLISLYSCNRKEKFECPCGGYGGNSVQIDPT